MEEKNRYLFLELLFTFILLEPVIFLFGDILSPYRIYFIFALLGGFSFSWFTRNKQSPLTAIFINLPVLAVFAWIVYSLLNSSLLYREVILIFIKGGIILEVIFSFSGSNPVFLSYIQALSLPLLMCFPVFIKDYNKAHAVLVLIYIICWILILRVKFYRLLKPLKENNVSQRVSVFIAAIIFFIIVFISWLLFYRLSLGKIEKGGFLLEEDRGLEVESEDLEKEYYELQDKVQKEITELIPRLNSNEDRQNMLLLLSSLIKDTSIVAEVKKAEIALVNRLKEPGPGIEKAEGEDIAIQIKNYLDKKAPFNLVNYKEKITDTLKRNKFNIIERISISNRIHKMRESDLNRKIKEYQGELNQIINNSSAKGNAKRDLHKQIEQFREWKTFEAYRKKTDSLNKKLDSLDSQLKKEFTDLLSDIDNIENPSEFKEAESKVERLEKTIPSEHRSILDDIKELLGLKSEMLLSQKARELKEKVDNLNLPGNEPQELKEKIDDIKDARDKQGLLKSLREYGEKIEENRIKESKKTKEFLEMKTHLIFNEKEDNIKDALKDSNLPDKGEELIRGLKNLESEKKSEKLISNTKKLKEDIEKLSSEGFISKAAKESLTKEIDEIKDLFRAELGAEKESARKESFEKTGEADYLDKWEELIDKSSLKKEKKEALKQLGKELSKAQTISQVENIEKATYETIEKLSMDGVKKEEMDKIKEAFDSMAEIKRKLIIEKSLADVRAKTEDLKRVDPGEAEKIEHFLEKIRDSRTNEELKKEIDDLGDYLDSKKQEQDEENKPEEIKETGNLQIYILPLKPIIPIGQSLSLRAVAVYNKVFIKEVSPQLDWFSSEPYVAWVDEKGIVHSLAKGKTQIYATFSGKDSQKIEVTVVDKIDEQVSSVVESEAIR